MALIPKEYFKSVFSIEVYKNKEYKCIGTGFLYFKIEKTEKNELQQDEHLGRTYLVTANHVLNIMDSPENLKEVFLKFDTLSGENARYFRMPLYNDKKEAIFCTPLETRDVAVIQIDRTKLQKEGVDFIEVFSDSSLLQDQYEDKGLANGDDVFFLGFPLGLRGEIKNYAICRGGIIARMDNETLEKNIIYLDAPVFPGNSGGPVFCKPQVVSISGTKPINRAYLLGIATNFLYKDNEANSAMTTEDIERLEGHLGLSKIVTVDAIEKAIDEYRIKFK